MELVSAGRNLATNVKQLGGIPTDIANLISAIKVCACGCACACGCGYVYVCVCARWWVCVLTDYEIYFFSFSGAHHDHPGRDGRRWRRPL